MTRQVDLQWFTVCGSIEIDELELNKAIRPMGCDHRYDLFLKIKHPNTQFYRGGWGPEILHFEDHGVHLGRIGRIYCSYDRYKQIAAWFLEAMYNSDY